MRTTKAVSISLPPAELKIAERLAKQTNRSLSGLFREGLKRLQEESRVLPIKRRASSPVADDYTPAQRCVIDAEIAASMEDFRRGRVNGPFETVGEASRYIEQVATQRAAARRRSRIAK